MKTIVKIFFIFLKSVALVAPYGYKMKIFIDGIGEN